MTQRQRQRLAPALFALLQARPIRWLANDPVALVHRYDDPQDIEIVGWWAAALAYGRVALFTSVIEKVLALAAGAPARYFQTFDPVRERPRFAKIAYRFHTPDDLFQFAQLTRRIVQGHGGVGALFLSLYDAKDADIGPTLARFVAATRLLLEGEMTPGLRHLLPSPVDGSACKRLNLYLRWMVRPSDGVDFGLWKAIPPGKLIVPLDTHLIRISRYLGLTRRATPGWKMAKEITEGLKALDADDPTRYDFSLCHLGISGDCPTVRNGDKCRACPLITACRRGRPFVVSPSFL